MTAENDHEELNQRDHFFILDQPILNEDININPPGKRGLSKWIYINDQLFNSDALNGLFASLNKLEIIKAEALYLWSRQIAELNVIWSDLSFKQKQKSVGELMLLFPIGQDSPWYVGGLLQLVSMHYELDDYTQVLDLLGKQDQSENWSTEQLWHSQWLQAESNLNLGRFPEAVTLFDALVKQLEAADSLSEAWRLNLIEIKASQFIAQSLFAFYIQKSALPDNEAIMDTLDAAITSGDATLIADVLYAQAINQVMHRHASESIALLDLAIELLEEAKVSKGLHLFYHQKAVTHFMFNQLDAALLNYREAMALVSEESHPLYWAGLHVSMAKVYRLLGEYQTASRYVSKAIGYYQQNQLQNELALAQQLMGRLASGQSSPQTAIKYHELSSAFFVENNEKWYIESLLELAISYVRLNDPLAEQLALQALLRQMIFLEPENAHIMAIADSLENSAMSNENQSTAIMAYKGQLIQAVLSSPSAVNATINRVLLIINESSKDSALEQHVLNWVLQAADTMQDWDIGQRLHIYQEVFQWLVQANDNVAIEILMNQALQLINDTQDQFLGTDTALHWTAKAQQLIDSYVSYLLEQGDVGRAFAVSEEQQSVNFRKRSAQVRHGRVVKNNSQSLNNYLAAVQQAVTDGSTASQKQLDVKRELFAKSQTQDHVADAKQEWVVLSIHAIQQRMAADEVAIRFIMGDQPHVFMISRDDWISQPLPEATQIKELVGQFIHSIRYMRGNYQGMAFRLSRMLRLNARLLQGKKRLVVVTEGGLASLPFAALADVLHYADYRPLMMSFELVQTPSLSAYYQDPKSQSEDTSSTALKTAAMFSHPLSIREASLRYQSQSGQPAPAMDDDHLLHQFQELPQTQREAELVNAVLKQAGVNVTWYNRNEMTNESILSDSTRAADIIHLATHGFFSDQSMDHVGLATTVEITGDGVEGGFLSLREIFSQTFTAQLVVISGCETIQGMQLDGEGLIGLSRGFLTQGVEQVVASIWAIPDRVTPDFMHQFYQGLIIENLAPAGALSQAQRHFYQRNTHYKHPFYWSGYVLTASN